MKNLIFIAIALLIAYFAYSQLTNNKNAATSNSQQASQQVDSTLISVAKDNAAVFIITPGNKNSVTSPFKVEFGITNMAIAPAGSDLPNSGHHHLLIDLAELPDMSQPLPASEQIVHFGKGQTETELDLPPGEHTLQLLMGNYLHIPHQQPVLSKRITITVE